jgi:hypothetical protein
VRNVLILPYHRQHTQDTQAPTPADPPADLSEDENGGTEAPSQRVCLMLSCENLPRKAIESCMVSLSVKVGVVCSVSVWYEV